MGRVNLPQEKRRTMYLYIDEFQNFTTDSVVIFLSEARKFGLSLTLANQNLAQLRTNSGNTAFLMPYWATWEAPSCSGLELWTLM